MVPPGTPLLMGAHTSTALGHIPPLQNQPEAPGLPVTPSPPAASETTAWPRAPALRSLSPPSLSVTGSVKIQYFPSFHLQSRFPPATQQLHQKQIAFTRSTKLLAIDSLDHTLKKCLQPHLLKIQELAFLRVPEGPEY